MNRWWLALAILVALASRSEAQETFVVPFSKPAKDNISIELVCQKDGRVGPFINISRLPQSTQKSAHIFSSINVIKNVDFFETTDKSVISFPVSWTYEDGPSGMTGFFIATADLKTDARQKFSDRLRSVTSDSQVYILQFLSSKYLGLEFNGKRYLTEIDLPSVSNARIAECLKFAGYDTALAQLKTSLRNPLDKEEMKQLCLQTFGYAAALEEYRPLLKDPAALTALVSYPLENRADCFSVTDKDRPRLTTSFLAGADRGLTLDYVGLGGAAQAAEIPNATLLLLKRDWGGGALPEVVEAERAKQNEDIERRLAYVYKLYARIKSCDEAFAGTNDRPYTRDELDKYRATMSQLAKQYGDRFNSDALWTEASSDYPAMLSKMRYSIGLDAKLASDGCFRNAGVFEAFASKLVTQKAQPKKDF
ncbi:MAG: hypothetical protein B7Y70_07990 [Rhizobiales bacterium 35-68-8]|nr:MAG: hypothetical protein B7Y70_07990 [Rhizobiales bacterium 35-68-8]